MQSQRTRVEHMREDHADAKRVALTNYNQKVAETIGHQNNQDPEINDETLWGYWAEKLSLDPKNEGTYRILMGYAVKPNN